MRKPHYSGRRQGGAHMDEVKKLKTLLEERPIYKINIGDLVKPEGYAQKLASSLDKTKRSQVRKIFSEFKQIFDIAKASLDKDKAEIEIKLAMLYPIVAYQEKRKLIDEHFADIIYALLRNLENTPTEDNFRQAENFLKAVVAYMKKEG